VTLWWARFAPGSVFRLSLPGWDAITVTQQAHLHGADFPRVVQKMLDSGVGADRPLSPAQMVVEKARIAMQRRLGENE
jgi:hypothetical protein